MADPNFKKISDMAALTTAAADDIIPIVDVSEAADANKNKKITTANLRKNITNAELAGSITAAKIAGISSDPNADRIVFWDDSATSLAYLAPSTGLQVTDTSITTKDSEIVHDNLSGFVADEHVAHAGVSITAGTGLSGGGTIAATRTLALSHLGIQSLADPNADRIMFWDDSAGAMKWLTAGTGLAISGTTLNAANIGSGDIADGAVTTAKIADRTRTMLVPINNGGINYYVNSGKEYVLSDYVDGREATNLPYFLVPSDYVSDLTISVFGNVVNGNASIDVYAAAEYGAIGESPGTHHTSNVAATVSVTNKIWTIFASNTLGSASAGDIVVPSLVRDGAAAGDTYGYDIYIYGIIVSYTADS